MARVADIQLIFADWACTRLCAVAIFFIACLSRILKIFCKKGLKTKSVFVYANDLLGDTMLKLPFFFSLRKEFSRSQYRIVIVLSPASAGMLRDLALFDEIIEEPSLHWRHPLFWIFSRKGMANSLKWAFFNTAEVFIVCHRMRSLGCDFAMSLLKPSTSVAYATNLETPMLPASARYQVKRYDQRYTHLLTVEGGRHQMVDMDRLLSLATGRVIKSPKPDKNLLEAILDFSLVDSFMASRYVVLVPGARVEYRRWPLDRFVEVANRLKCTVVIVGSAEEAPLAKTIAAATNCRAVDLCGKTTLSQLGGVLYGADLVVSNETGTASYSAILGAKTVCILGGGDFGSFFPNPYYSNTLSVFHKDECFYCGWKCRKANLGNSKTAPCIKDITVGDVMNAIERLPLNMFIEGRKNASCD